MAKIGILNELAHHYDKILLDSITTHTSMANEFLFGKIIGYKKEKVTKYWKIPTLSVKKHYEYDDDGEEGEFVGYLVKWDLVDSKIPIGKETIEVPIYKKETGKYVTFKRYSDLYANQK